MLRSSSGRAGVAAMAIVALLVLTAACAKDDPVSAPPPASTSRTTAATGAADGTTTTPSVVVTTAEEAAFCARFKDFAERANGLTNDNAEDLAKAKAFFQELASSAPPAIQSEMTQFNQWVQGLTKADVDPPDELKSVGERIGTWAAAHCGR